MGTYMEKIKVRKIKKMRVVLILRVGVMWDATYAKSFIPAEDAMMRFIIRMRVIPN